MLHFLRDHFVPHSGNDHQPHILRIETTLVLVTAVFFVQALFLFQVYYVMYKTDALATIISSVLVDKTNVSRTGSDLRALTVSPILEKAAQMKADDMAKYGYFAHTSPTGITPWHWFDEAGYEYVRAGENLAINFVDSEDVIRAWLDSPTHRANIMNPGYAEIGIAMSRGNYNGKEAIFVVQEFGTQRGAVVASGEEVPVKRVETAKTIVRPPEEEKPVEAARQVVAGTETIRANIAPQPVASAWTDKILAQPRVLTTIFFSALATLVVLALGIFMFIRMAVPHPHLLMNGILFLVIIGSVLIANYSIAAMGRVL